MEGVMGRAVSSLAKKVSWKAYSDLLAYQGRYLEAVDYLQDLAAQKESFEIERRLVQLRGEAGAVLVRDSQPMPHPCVTDEDVAPGFPLSIATDEISPSAVRKGIATNGFLWVKGFFDDTQTKRLQSVVQHSLKALEHATAEENSGGTPWYEYYVPRITPPSAAFKDRISNRYGSLRICDTPRGLSTWLHLAQESGLLQIVQDYLSTRPILSTFKSTFRQPKPGPENKAWHQDGAFMGPVHTLNVWVALTNCGRDAPGMDLIPERMEILETGTEDAIFDWSVAPALINRRFADRIVRPEFEAGDILLFDETLLHRTAIEPTMTSARYAIESWFFHPSAYPEEFAVLAV